jgi:hypothetical protein
MPEWCQRCATKERHTPRVFIYTAVFDPGAKKRSINLISEARSKGLRAQWTPGCADSRARYAQRAAVRLMNGARPYPRVRPPVTRGARSALVSRFASPGVDTRRRTPTRTRLSVRPLRHFLSLRV